MLFKKRKKKSPTAWDVIVVTENTHADSYTITIIVD